MATTKNTADLLAQAVSTLPDNTTQQISPQDSREMAENVAQSSYNKISDSALVGLKDHSTIPAYESGQGTVNGGKVYISNKITGPGAFVGADWDLYDELSAAEKTKLGYLTVTAGADLDQMQTDIAALDGARINKGTFDQALGAFPGGGTAQDGWTWIAVGVTTTIDGVEINPDDAIVAITDNASTTVFASNWHLQDNTDKVISVNTKAGVVVLDKTDIGLSNVPNTDATDRANHTGTQVVATISDFDAEVASNTAVAANTAKVSADGLVTTHSDVDSSTLANKKNNLTAIIAPVVGDDNLDGYEVGSIWLDVTADKGYICLDTTTATAVWKEVTVEGGGATEVGLGLNSIQQVGVTSSAGGAAAIALGQNSTSSADQTIAIGLSSVADNAQNIAIGRQAQAKTNSGTIAVGYLSVSTNVSSISIGGSSGASGYAAIALGGITTASNTGSISIGERSVSSAQGSIAIGRRMSATATNALMIGGGFGTVRTNATANSVEFNFDEATSTVRLARTVDSWINTSANFGIGLNTALGAKLHVKGNDTLSGTKGLIVENSLAAAALTVTNDGNVGIGVNAATPPVKLTVDGAIGFSYTTLGSSSNGIKRNGVYTDYYNTIASTGTLIAHQFTVTGSAAALTILQSKNVGIGIIAPTEKLHVVGSTLLNGNLGVFGTTPIAQPTTAVASSVIVAGAGVNALQDDTYGGYTMAQVVQALQNLGVLA